MKMMDVTIYCLLLTLVKVFMAGAEQLQQKERFLRGFGAWLASLRWLSEQRQRMKRCDWME
jgi:hypothetical protein